MSWHYTGTSRRRLRVDLRLPPALLVAVQQAAAEDASSVNGWIVDLLEQVIAKRAEGARGSKSAFGLLRAALPLVQRSAVNARIAAHLQVELLRKLLGIPEDELNALFKAANHEAVEQLQKIIEPINRELNRP